VTDDTLDVDLERRVLEHAEQVDVRQPDEDLADLLRVADKASGEAASAHPVRLAPPDAQTADGVPPSDPKLRDLASF
jgi:hypothetical protein